MTTLRYWGGGGAPDSLQCPAPFDHLDGASIHFGLIVGDLLYSWSISSVEGLSLNLEKQ